MHLAVLLPISYVRHAGVTGDIIGQAV